MEEFVCQNFTGWKSVNLHGLKNLVIDGNSVCSQLYLRHHGGGILGGNYFDYHTTVREYFTEILFTGVQVTVLLNGIDYEQKRMDADRKYRTDFNMKLRISQSRMGWGGEREGIKVIPLLMVTVFKDAIQSLGIQLRVVDDEAGKETAAIANHLKCPVLAADPKYYLFELEYGYLPFDQLSTVIANGLVYNVREFQCQFGLKDSKLRLILPTDDSKIVDFKDFLTTISAYEAVEDYLVHRDDEGVKRHFEAAVKNYCELPLPLHQDPKNLASSVVFVDLPKFVIHSLRTGAFQPQLLNVYTRNIYLAEPVIEDIKRDSAWLASRHIRQFLYGFMGVSSDCKVTEITRAKSSPEVIEVFVSPQNFEHALTYRTFYGKSREESAHVVLAVLKCDKISPHDMRHEFEKLDNKWKLPIAATFYWYNSCDNPPVQRHLVKSLLLSFLACSELITREVPPLDQITRGNKEDHLIALHAFAQWQCVYYDTISLNQLTREPFETTSPHYLYSGIIAMYYASLVRKNIPPDRMIVKGSEEWNLYNRFLYLVTGCDGEGRKGKHAKHQPKTKKLSAPKEGPPISQANRFSQLAVLDD